MKKQQVRSLALMLTVLVQSACATLSLPATQTTPAGACPTETANLKLLVKTDDGYCLLYPAEETVLPPRSIVINPARASADTPGAAWVDISVEAAAGRTAVQVAEERIAEAGAGFNITHSELLVDGKQAMVVDGLPGPDSWRQVFVVAHDRLYTLSFLPWAPTPDGATPLEKLYATVIDTLHFLPPTP